MKLLERFVLLLCITAAVQGAGEVSSADRGRMLMEFPGLCMDCGYFIPGMHCDLSIPCTIDTCRKVCIDDTPQSSAVNRPSLCDPAQYRQPGTYLCWWDDACAANERCCITDNGSYCSS